MDQLLLWLDLWDCVFNDIGLLLLLLLRDYNGSHRFQYFGFWLTRLGFAWFRFHSMLDLDLCVLLRLHLNLRNMLLLNRLLLCLLLLGLLLLLLELCRIGGLRRLTNVVEVNLSLDQTLGQLLCIYAGRNDKQTFHRCKGGCCQPWTKLGDMIGQRIQREQLLVGIDLWQLYNHGVLFDG